MVAPELFDGTEKTKPLPLPPAALKVCVPLVFNVTAAGVMVMPAVTVTFRVVVAPAPSLSWTTSVAFPLAPAVYAPDEALIDPPDWLVASDQPYAPLPPLPLNWIVPRGGAVAVARVMARGSPPTAHVTGAEDAGRAVMPAASATTL